MDDDIGLAEVIESIIEYSMEDRYTALPAVVLAVHSQGGTQLVDVQPCVSINNRDGTLTDQASVLNVPYQQPASSKGGMVFPILPGDNVLLIYCMRGIDTWKYGQGTPSPASDYRMFSKMDCIAIPCISPVSKTPTAGRHTKGYALGDVVVYNAMNGNQCEVILKANGDVVVNSPGTVTINSPRSVFNGDVEFKGDSVTHNGVNIGDTHKHSGVESGGSNTGEPT